MCFLILFFVSKYNFETTSGESGSVDQDMAIKSEDPQLKLYWLLDQTWGRLLLIFGLNLESKYVDWHQDSETASLTKADRGAAK